MAARPAAARSGRSSAITTIITGRPHHARPSESCRVGPPARTSASASPTRRRRPPCSDPIRTRRPAAARSAATAALHSAGSATRCWPSRPAAAPCARPVGSASSSWSAAAEEEEAGRWGRLGRGIGPRGRCRAGGREHLPGVLVGSRRARVGRGMCWGGHGWVTWRGGQAEDTVTSAWCVCVCGP